MKCIWLKDATNRLNVSLGFRYVFEKAYEKVTFKIAAVSTFRVFLNGEFLFAGPVRSGRGQSIVLKKELRIQKGDILVVEVCNYLINAFYPMKEDGFFACEGISDGEKIFDSDDFAAFLLSDRIEKTQRLSFQRSFTEGYDMRSCRSDYRLGKDTFSTIETKEVIGRTLLEKDVPHCAWNTLFSEEIERGETYAEQEENPLKPRIFDYVENDAEGYHLVDCEVKISQEVLQLGFVANVKSGNELGTGEYALYAFERNATGFIGVNVEVEEDSELFLLFDETIWEEGLAHSDCALAKKWQALPLIFCRSNVCNAVYYRLKKGTYRLLTSEPYTLQYLKIVCKKGKLKIDAAPHLILWQNDEAYRLQPNVQGEKLQKIFEAARNTLAQNTTDVPTDCPGRERAGWLCDSFFTSRAEWVLCGNNKCEENFFEALLTEENYAFLPEGMFPMCYPADHNDGKFIPNWALWLVLEVYDHWKRTGKTEYVFRFKERFYRLFEYFKSFLNEEGLLENLDGWVFVEWSQCNKFTNGVNYPTNMLYAKAIRCMSEMYTDCVLSKEYETIREKVIEQSFDGRFFREHSVRENGTLVVRQEITETCQYYAFFLGIIDKEEYAELFRFMFERVQPFGLEECVDGRTLYKANTFIGVILRFSYLFEIGQKEKLLSELVDYFYPMAEKTGTLWELNDSKSSLNHGFTSIVATWILKDN